MRAHSSLRLGTLRGTTPELLASPWYCAWGFCMVWEAGLPHKTSSPLTQRRNGRACSSLTARGGGLPVGITYHPQSGWFEDTPLKGGTEEGCPLKGVHEGTFLIEAGHPAWNHSRASGLTVVLRLGLLYGLGSGAPPQDVLSSHATPERQSLFESHRQRRWLTRWSYSP